jgi:pimeloyl-ACP methyl ester carboxylesterase
MPWVGRASGRSGIPRARRRSDRSRASAVLLEPVIFESPDAPELGWRNPFIERTLKRRRIFDGVEAMYSNFENKPPYNTWRKDILRDYCEFGTRSTSDGKRELKCAPEIEAKFYETARDFDGLGRILRCDVPLIVLFGARGDSLGASLSGKVARQLKHGRVMDVADTGHFLPMEKPDFAADRAIEFLKPDSSA